MKLKNLGSNMNELVINDTRVLISYETPVACIRPANNFDHLVAERTDKKWSRTTSKHINKWLASNGCASAKERDQSFFDNLLNEVK